MKAHDKEPSSMTNAVAPRQKRDLQPQISAIQRRRILLGSMTWDEAKKYVASLPLAETIDEARLRETYEPCRAAVERLPTALTKNPEIKAMHPHLSKQLARLAASYTCLN